MPGTFAYSPRRGHRPAAPATARRSRSPSRPPTRPTTPRPRRRRRSTSPRRRRRSPGPTRRASPTARPWSQHAARRHGQRARDLQPTRRPRARSWRRAARPLSVTFTPTDTTDYTTATATATDQRGPGDADDHLGQPGGHHLRHGRSAAPQLDATASVPGTFTYTPAAGTVLGAGDPDPLGHLHAHRHDRLHDAPRRRRRSTSAQATPTITWANPASITYGTPLSAQRSSTRRPACPGPSAYTPAAGTVLRGGRARRSSVTFTPTDTTDYTTATATATIDGRAGDADDHLGQPGGHHLRHGARRPQLDATASVPGTFAYTRPPAPSWAPAHQTLSVTFTPTDTTDYTTCTADGDDQRRAGDARRSPGAPGGDHLRHGAGADATRRDGQRARDLRLHAGRRDGPGGRQSDAVGDLHADRHDRLHDGDDDRAISVTQATPDDHLGQSRRRSPTARRWRHAARRDGQRAGDLRVLRPPRARC